MNAIKAWRLLGMLPSMQGAEGALRAVGQSLGSAGGPAAAAASTQPPACLTPAHVRQFGSSAGLLADYSSATGEAAASSRSSSGLAASSSSGGAVGAAPPAQQPQPALSDAQFEELVSVLLHPIPQQRRELRLIMQQLVQVGDTYFLDPEAALASTMRALHVVRQVLRQDGHVYVLGGHPLLRPLVQEAAHSCVNANVWWMTDDWPPGAISNCKAIHALFSPEHQPAAARFRRAGLAMTNPLCPRPPVLSKAPQRLSSLDKWRLLARRRPEARQALEAVMDAELGAARLPLQGSALRQERVAQLRCMVVLDPSLGASALKEADGAHIMTIAPVNAHTKQVANIAYPLYARENHPAYTRFFLDWLLKVASVRPSQPAS